MATDGLLPKQAENRENRGLHPAQEKKNGRRAQYFRSKVA